MSLKINPIVSICRKNRFVKSWFFFTIFCLESKCNSEQRRQHGLKNLQCQFFDAKTFAFRVYGQFPPINNSNLRFEVWDLRVQCLCRDLMEDLIGNVKLFKEIYELSHFSQTQSEKLHVCHKVFTIFRTNFFASAYLWYETFSTWYQQFPDEFTIRNLTFDSRDRCSV